jgi:hypothetical protein
MIPEKAGDSKKKRTKQRTKGKSKKKKNRKKYEKKGLLSLTAIPPQFSVLSRRTHSIPHFSPFSARLKSLDTRRPFTRSNAFFAEIDQQNSDPNEMTAITHQIETNILSVK